MIASMLHKVIDLLGTEVMFVFTYHFILRTCVVPNMILIILSYNGLGFNNKLGLLLLVISLPNANVIKLWISKDLLVHFSCL